MVIDGVDGRVHHLEVGELEAAKEARIGSIVEVGRRADLRAADRTIAELSRGIGKYHPSYHRKLIDSGDIRLPPGADADAFVDSHVRRLEALRRAGIVQRFSAERWGIPEDFEQRAQAYEAGRGRAANLRVLSALDLDQQVTSDGATWIDRQLVSRNRVALVTYGFGAEVGQAFEARKEELVRQGHATRTPEGGVIARRDLLRALQQTEVERVGSELAAQRGLPFRTAEPGESVRGKFTGTVQLASGKFAMVEHALEFQLVPWRPVIENQLAREVAGVMRDGGGIEWKVGRSLGIGL